MLTTIKHWLAPPVFEDDEEKTRVAHMLNTLALAASALLLLAGLILVPARWGQPDVLPNVVRMVLAVSLLVLVLVLIRRGQVRLAGMIFSLVIWINGLIIIYTTGGIRSYEFPAVMATILAVGLLLGVRAAVVAIVLTVLAQLGLIYAGINGLLPTFDTVSYTSIQILVSRSIGLVAMIVLLYLFAQGIEQVSQRARRYAATLEEYRERLEATVQDRTHNLESLERRYRYLAATAEVARQTSTMLDVEELLLRVVNLVSEQFGFYHAGIFFLDPTGEWAVLRAASSAGGQQMLANGHRLRVGEVGIVGYVTDVGEARVAFDVGADAVYFDNPYLPETRSEIALPLVARGKVIGVLDVQSKETNAFSDEDIAVLQTLADQVAVAISNARLLQQAQDSLAAERRVFGELSRQAWLEVLRTRPDLGFFRDEGGVSPAGDLWHPEMEQALQLRETIQNAGGDAGERHALAVPIKVRDAVIGVIDFSKPDADSVWTAEEIALVEALTEQLGVALERARLYEDTRRRAAREQMSAQVAARMRESLDMETVLRTAVAEMRQALGLEGVIVQLARPEAVSEVDHVA